MRMTGARCERSRLSWRVCVLRGDVHVLRPPQRRGHERQDRRFGVVVQANELLPKSVVLVAPTSRSARPASFRPEIELLGETKFLGRVVTQAWSPGWMVVFGSPWPSPCTSAKRPPLGRECAQQGPGSHLPAKPGGRDPASQGRRGTRCSAPQPTSTRTRAGQCVATERQFGLAEG